MRFQRRVARGIGTGVVVSAILGMASGPAEAGRYGGRPESFQPDLATGRFTSSFDIPVPPGRRGMQPTLALRIGLATCLHQMKLELIMVVV